MTADPERKKDRLNMFLYAFHGRERRLNIFCMARWRVRRLNMLCNGAGEPMAGGAAVFREKITPMFSHLWVPRIYRLNTVVMTSEEG